MYTLGDIFIGNFPVTQPWGGNQYYDYTKFFIYGVQQKGHEGVDFGTPNGVPIISPFDGIVLRQDYQSDFTGYGKVVVVWDPVQKCAVWFCHLNDEQVVTGQSIKKTQVLGHTGSTGNITGPHLHLGLVETDAYGNRLHPYDGYGGFINSLDPNKVKWELGTPPSTVDWGAKFDAFKVGVNRLKTETDTAASSANKEAAYKDGIAKAKKLYETGTL